MDMRRPNVSMKPSASRSREYVSIKPAARRSEGYSYWDREARRWVRPASAEASLVRGLSEATFSNVPLPPGYNLHPPAYRGFLANTYISLSHHRLQSPVIASLSFRGRSYSTPVAIRGIGLSDPTSNKITIAENADHDWRTVTIPSPTPSFFPPPPPWGLPDNLVDPDRFDHVTLRVEGPGEIRLTQITICLNDETILHKDFSSDPRFYPPYRIVDEAHPLALDHFIASSRLAMIHYDLLPPPSLLHAPVVNVEVEGWANLRILRIAANDIGEAWDPFCCPWRYDLGTPPGEPTPWCDEYAARVIARATGGAVSPPVGGIAMMDWMKTTGIYRSPDEGIRYRDLPDLILPGFLARLQRGGHMNFFIGWVQAVGSDRHAPPLGRAIPGPYFEPDKSPNYFLAIGGNQRGAHTVNVRVYSVSDGTWERENLDQPWADIVWDNFDDLGNPFEPGEQDRRRFRQDGFLDGFADTRFPAFLYVPVPDPYDLVPGLRFEPPRWLGGRAKGKTFRFEE